MRELHRRLYSLGLVCSVLAAGVAGACAVVDDPVTAGSGGGSAGATTQGGGGAGQGGNGTGGGFGQGGNIPQGKPIVIEPAQFQLVVQPGSLPTQPVKATIDGVDVTDQVTWSFQKPFIGDVANGEFVPTGNAGGVGTLSAALGTSTGQATATVYVHKVVGENAVTPAQKAALDNPLGGADPSLDWLYPFDQTVFPLDVLGPEMMWNGVSPTDAYKLHIQEKYVEYTEYFSTSTPASHTLTDLDWESLGLSGTGAQSDPLSVELGRYSAGLAYEPVQRTWHIAQGKLKGVVYYWELPDQCGGGNGRILRIKPSSLQAVEFFQPGGCWGCHTVSRDGKSMFAALDTNFPFPQISVDLTVDPAQPGSIAQSALLTGTFGAYNDKGDRLLVSNDNSGSPNKLLTIVEAQNGGALAGQVMGPGCGEPAWSPDGKKIAAICGVSGGGWIFDSQTGHLDVADVAADGFTWSNQETIVPQAGEQGRPAYPSFAPSSEFIAYGRPTVGSRSNGEGDLWLTDLTGTNVKRLDNASIDNRSFNPVFAPLRAGGYYWLVYISRADYGNKLVGADRQQLWITAINDPPTADDPSNPPFYLRGQESCGKSENAYFALEPCKELGEACSSGVDCCNGNCIKDPQSGEYKCSPPSECALDGNACETAADCCNPFAECLDGFCTPPIPM